MRKIKIFCFVIIVGIILFFAVQFVISIINDPFSPTSPNYYYRDRIVYPLEALNKDDDSEYLILKWQHSPEEKFEVVTDTTMIKENISTFSLDNDGDIYGVTADGFIELYKDGKHISTELFDNTYTKKIEYGSLQFRQVNELQFRLLLGAEILEQEQYFSILRGEWDGAPYYYFFAHGDDLESFDKVYLLDSGPELDDLPVPQSIRDDTLAFIDTDKEYNIGRTWHLNLTDFSIKG